MTSPPAFSVVQLKHGVAIHGDGTSPEVIDWVLGHCGPIPLIVADPPYGNIVDQSWDSTSLDDKSFCRWMLDWTRGWAKTLQPGAAFYVWGGVGKPGFRPFFRYLTEVEAETSLSIANLITWAKKRAYGVQPNQTEIRRMYATRASSSSIVASFFMRLARNEITCTLPRTYPFELSMRSMDGALSRLPLSLWSLNPNTGHTSVHRLRTYSSSMSKSKPRNLADCLARRSAYFIGLLSTQTFDLAFHLSGFFLYLALFLSATIPGLLTARCLS